MKAIIIENEYEVDVNVQHFLQDYPDLFESVDEQLYCLHRSEEELIKRVMAADAIVVASTWMYKDQLEDFLDGFLTEGFPPKKVFAYWISKTLNEWKFYPESWRREPEIIEKIEALIKKGWEFYDYYSDWTANYIPETASGAWTSTRLPLVYQKLTQNEEGWWYTKQQSVEEFKQDILR